MKTVHRAEKEFIWRLASQTWIKSKHISTAGPLIKVAVFPIVVQCYSRWSLGKVGGNGATASRFIGGKSSLHHVKSINGSIRNPLNRKSYLGKAIRRKQQARQAFLFTWFPEEAPAYWNTCFSYPKAKEPLFRFKSSLSLFSSWLALPVMLVVFASMKEII